MEGGGQLRRRHYGGGLVDEPPDLGSDLPLQQVVEDRSAGGDRHRRIVDGQGELTVVVDQIGHGSHLRRGLGEAAGSGERFLDGGQVALEGWVHRPPPAPAVVPAVSERTAAMASSMRS